MTEMIHNPPPRSNQRPVLPDNPSGDFIQGIEYAARMLRYLRGRDGNADGNNAILPVLDRTVAQIAAEQSAPEPAGEWVSDNEYWTAPEPRDDEPQDYYRGWGDGYAAAMIAWNGRVSRGEGLLDFGAQTVDGHPVKGMDPADKVKLAAQLQCLRRALIEDLQDDILQAVADAGIPREALDFMP